MLPNKCKSELQNAYIESHKNYVEAEVQRTEFLALFVGLIHIWHGIVLRALPEMTLSTTR